MDKPEKITLETWDVRYKELLANGLKEGPYGGPISRHVNDGDYRLLNLQFDNSAASLRLWNFLLTEEDRLLAAKEEGKKLVGAMKDLGTVPVMAYSFPNLVAFYPDGAWWIPCVMELSAGLLEVADSLGIDESFCPVRAMLGAFLTQAHYPIPDFLTCNVGAVCDDFSVIAQRLNSLGYPIFWWESPHRRHPEPQEDSITLPGGFEAPNEQINFLKMEFGRIRRALEKLAGGPLSDYALSTGIRKANDIRRILREIRRLTFNAENCPMPALEMLIAEMLAIHFCSDREESLNVLQELLREIQKRTKEGVGVLPQDAVKIFWVNPVADLRVMNLLEECGGRICGTEYLFSHALDEIPEDIPPLEALARMALADPMTGSVSDRAQRIINDIKIFHSEACLVSRIPGASHCSVEGNIIREKVQAELGIPTLEIEVSPISDSMVPTLRTRLEAVIETVKEGRKQ